MQAHPWQSANYSQGLPQSPCACCICCLPWWGAALPCARYRLHLVFRARVASGGRALSSVRGV
eukprot:15431881-Alexandrium_andersonii.AAC.1